MDNTVLLIEDDVFFSKIIENKLKDEYSLVVKENGLEAMHWLKEGETPSLIIADLNMPQMNGYELISKLKSHPSWSKIPLIIVSGEDCMQIKNRIWKAGAHKFFRKPLNLHELSDSVRELIDINKN